MQKTGQKIKILIAAKGWTLGDFAEAIGYDRSAFSRAINSDNPSAKVLEKIAKKLGVSASLFTGPEEIGPGNMPPEFDLFAGLPLEKGSEPVDNEELELRKELARVKEENALLIKTQADLVELLKKKG